MGAMGNARRDIYLWGPVPVTTFGSRYFQQATAGVREAASHIVPWAPITARRRHLCIVSTFMTCGSGGRICDLCLWSSSLFCGGGFPFYCRTEGSSICVTSTTVCCYRFYFMYACGFVFHAVGTCTARCVGKTWCSFILSLLTLIWYTEGCIWDCRI